MFETNNTQSGSLFSSILSDNIIVLAAAGIVALIFVILLFVIITGKKKKKSKNKENADPAAALQQNTVFQPMSAADGYPAFPQIPDAAQFPVYPQIGMTAPAAQTAAEESELSSWGSGSWDFDTDPWGDSPDSAQDDCGNPNAGREYRHTNDASVEDSVPEVLVESAEAEHSADPYQAETYKPEPYRPESYKPEPYKPAAYTHKADDSYSCFLNDTESAQSKRQIIADDALSAFSSGRSESNPSESFGNSVKSAAFDQPSAEAPLPSVGKLEEQLTELTVKLDELTFAMSALSETFSAAVSSGRASLREDTSGSSESDAIPTAVAAVEGEKPKKKRGRKKIQQSSPEDETGKEA